MHISHLPLVKLHALSENPITEETLFMSKCFFSEE